MAGWRYNALEGARRRSKALEGTRRRSKAPGPCSVAHGCGFQLPPELTEADLSLVFEVVLNQSDAAFRQELEVAVDDAFRTKVSYEVGQDAPAQALRLPLHLPAGTTGLGIRFKGTHFGVASEIAPDENGDPTAFRLVSMTLG